MPLVLLLVQTLLTQALAAEPAPAAAPTPAPAVAPTPAPAVAPTPAPAPAPAPSAVPAPVGVPPPSDTVLGTLDVVGAIDRAVEVRQAGDPAGARTLLAGIEAFIPGETLAWYLYQRGICEELDGKPLAAKGYYEPAILAFEAGAMSGPATAADARFRLALVLEELGDGAGALAQMQTLARARGLDTSDGPTVALQHAMSEVAAGRTSKGLRDLDAALLPFAEDDAARAAGAASGPPVNAWLRAKARYTLVHVLLLDAARLKLNGRGRHDARAIEAWADSVKAAQEQVLALTYLQSADLDATWLMRSLLELGDSFAMVSAVLVAAPVPASLDAAQALVYRRELARKAENAKTNAWHLYDQAIGAAQRLHFESPLVVELEARRASIPR